MLIEELERAATAMEQAGESGERMRARVAALREAPAGAGWSWLAAHGDEAAALVVARGPS
jgi:hypothetical protein